MATFNIDSLIYTDKLPHSRVERILYQILKKQGSGGGGDDVTLVVDDPSDVGNGLTVKNAKLYVDYVEKMDNSSKPITSGAIYEQLQLANQIMQKI